MKKTAHIFASIVAMTCIATFMLATVIVELFGKPESIAMIKGLIVSPGLFVLVPAIAITGASGFALAGGRRGRLIEMKKKRMPIIAANGILILIPSAIFLEIWASSGAFHITFYLVQMLELLAGSINLFLMSKNMRDGFRLSGRFR